MLKQSMVSVRCERGFPEHAGARGNADMFRKRYGLFKRMPVNKMYMIV